MKQTLSLIAKIHDKGNRFIIEQLEQNGAEGLVPSHGDILNVLYKYEKLTMKEIADKIHRTKPTVTVLVDKLEKLDFVKRVASSNDNRCTYIVLTQKGKEFEPIFKNISLKLNKMLHSNLSQEEAIVLEKLLMKISQ